MKVNVNVDILTNDAKIHLEKEPAYDYPACYGVLKHEELASFFSGESQYHHEKPKFNFTMIAIESERLADCLWDDPEHMHITNILAVSESREQARREMCNKYMGRSELEAFLDRFNFPRKTYNYKDTPKGEREFRYAAEDSVFDYQESLVQVEILASAIEDCKYKMDEDLYLIEDDDGQPILEDDTEVIANQRKRMLERLLRPRHFSKYERVYHMPHPFNHWDSRSFYHQFFCIEDLERDALYIFRGNSGSSGARETNGRWAHVFATLYRKYGVYIPTYHLLYDSYNQLKHLATYPVFRCFRYDRTGNYHADYRESDILFKDMTLEPYKDRFKELMSNEEDEIKEDEG